MSSNLVSRNRWAGDVSVVGELMMSCSLIDVARGLFACCSLSATWRVEIKPRQMKRQGSTKYFLSTVEHTPNDSGMCSLLACLCQQTKTVGFQKATKLVVKRKKVVQKKTMHNQMPLVVGSRAVDPAVDPRKGAT